MFLRFFLLLRSHGLPIGFGEYLTLLEGCRKELHGYDAETFYGLARTVLVKHEKHLDLFDRLFAVHFGHAQAIPAEVFAEIPAEWLESDFLRQLTDEGKAALESLGGLDALMERLKQLLDEQQERHEGGNRWIGTGGTSPFGANGYNPEGYRIGQEEGHHRKAVKVWEKREFRNLDDDELLSKRNVRLALRKLRKLTREGKAEELDLPGTIRQTSRQAGLLDLSFQPSRQNRVKVLLLLDTGGSMDPHAQMTAELFAAARHEFKHLEFFYFHNCVYESLWKDNRRRHSAGGRIATLEVLRKYNSDWKVVFVGDAAMSPYEVIAPGGSVEHWNEEAGEVWLRRFVAQFPALVWLNPDHPKYWDSTRSTQLIRDIVNDRMFSLTPAGIGEAVKVLKNPGAWRASHSA